MTILYRLADRVNGNLISGANQSGWFPSLGWADRQLSAASFSRAGIVVAHDPTRWRYEPGHCVKCDVEWGPGVWDNHRGEVQGTLEGGNVFFVAGADYWFGASIYVPTDWVPDQYGETWFQFHANEDVGDTAGTPIIYLHGNRLGIIEINLAYSSGNPSEPGTETLIVNPTLPVAPGSWHDIVLNFNEDHTGATGKCHAWLGGTRVLAYEGPLGFENDLGGYWKFGVYKGAWSTGGGATTSGTPVRRRTYWYDEIVTGDANESYATIAPRGGLQPVYGRGAQSIGVPRVQPRGWRRF